MGEVAQKIEHLLRAAFPDALIALRDDSHKHAGHAGSRSEGETHFHLTITSAAFNEKSRVAQHKMVFAALEELLRTRVHALQIVTKPTA